MSCQELKEVVIGSGENAQHSFFVALSNMVLKLFNLRFFIIIIISFLYIYSRKNQKRSVFNCLLTGSRLDEYS